MERRFDLPAITAAIEEAERKTSAEIRVSVSPFFWGEVQSVAAGAFHHLGMDQTAERNGVLIFVVPSRRQFVIFGDVGIHAKAGQELWDRSAALIGEKFRAKDFTGGLLAGIAEIGMALATHFPPKGEADKNELPNEVHFDH